MEEKCLHTEKKNERLITFDPNGGLYLEILERAESAKVEINIDEEKNQGERTVRKRGRALTLRILTLSRAVIMGNKGTRNVNACA